MKRIPFPIIKAVKEFDAEAVGIVFRHFERYIENQCACYYTNKQGNTQSYVDEDLRYQAEIALFNAIVSFQFKEPHDFMA